MISNTNALSDPGVFDVVIRTQAEFETLIASPTWLDAVSVCFIGNGGTLKFVGALTIPPSVKILTGMNSAIIEGCVRYLIRPITSDCCITGLTVNARYYNATAFTNCLNLTDCFGGGYDPDESVGGGVRQMH